MSVIPPFVSIGRDFFTASIGAPVHALVERKDVGIVFSKAKHPILHRLVRVVFLELQDALVGRGPREDVIDVILRPNALWR